MKVILNTQISQTLMELQKEFPPGTAMTHIVNVAIKAYHQQISPSKKDSKNANSATPNSA